METQPILPLFTVIIPAKNRGVYLEHTLRTCMIQEYPNFEIIVSDDDSTDNSKEVVENSMKLDSRIKFFPHKPGLGMRDNFEFALNQVRPGYVIALGGDDGLIPGSIQKMHDILTKTKTELLTWPSPHYIFYDGDFCRLVIIKCKGQKIIKSKDFLNRVTNSLDYISDIECPMFYIKGVVSTKLIHSVKSKTKDNYFYSCATPDGYSGIVLAGEVDEYSFTGEPLSIGGDSSASQGRAYINKDDQSKKAAESFYNYSLKRPMHKELASQPYSPLITLMSADYLLTARDLPGLSGHYPPIDYENLIRKCFVEIEIRYSESELITRELNIVKNIAKQHGLIDLFNKLISSKWKLRSRPSLDGSIITPRSIIFDSKKLGINNIYDASHATKYFYNFYMEANLKNIFSLIVRIIDFYMKSKKYKVEKFPVLDNY